MEVTFLELQSRDVAGPGKLSGYHQESMAKSGKRKRLPVLGETEPFKPSHKSRSRGSRGQTFRVGVRVGDRLLYPDFLFGSGSPISRQVKRHRRFQ
jgi:hypothetical protein